MKRELPRCTDLFVVSQRTLDQPQPAFNKQQLAVTPSFPRQLPPLHIPSFPSIDIQCLPLPQTYINGTRTVRPLTYEVVIPIHRPILWV